MKRILLLAWLLASAFATAVHAADVPGFESGYIVRTGHFNNDSLLDIYLEPKKKIVPIALDDLSIPIVLPPNVGEFVLQQNPGGDFSLVSSLTYAAKQAAKNWAIQQAIKIIRNDLNVDGVLDVILGKVGTVIPGGKNVIIFASPTQNGAPSVIRNVDSTLDQFIRDVGGFSDNPYHFQSGVYVVCQTIYLRTLHYDPYTLEYYYSWDPYVICDYYFDPSGFSIPAINFLNRLVPVANSGQLVAQSDNAISISRQLQDLFGTMFFKGVLEFGGYSDDTECQGIPYPDADRCLGPRRLGDLVDILRDLVTGARDSVSCSRGVPHHYALEPGDGAISMCELGHPLIAPYCSTQNLYHEQLTHPVLGFLTNRQPIREGQTGIAQFGFPGSFDNAGPIIFHVNKPILWHQNETLPGHDFHHGWVNRQTIVQNNKLYITTEGGGTGDCATFNVIVGVSVFRALDVVIWNHLANQAFVNHQPIP